MSLREEIRELCIAHDKQMAEDREWLARRGQARPFVRKSDDPAGLIFKTVENEPAPASEGDPWAGWNAWMGAHLDNLRAEIENALVDLVVLLRKDWEQDIRRAVTERDAEIAHLRGQVEVLTRLYASKSADIHDLPMRPKDVA